MAKGFMKFQEWRDFVKSIVAGIFGVLVVLVWHLFYGSVKEKGFLWQLIVPNVLTFTFFIILILFLRWLFLKKEKMDINELAREETTNKKIKYNEKSLKLWQEVGKDEYLSRRGEWAQIDSKIYSLLIIILAIIGITIQYVEIGNLLSPQRGAYILSLIFLGISFVCCLLGLWPKRLDIINFEHNKNNDYKKELLVLKNQYDLSISNQNAQLDKKLFFFKVSSIAFFIGVLILVLIKFGVSF